MDVCFVDDMVRKIKSLDHNDESQHYAIYDYICELKEHIKILDSHSIYGECVDDCLFGLGLGDYIYINPYDDGFYDYYLDDDDDGFDFDHYDDDAEMEDRNNA